ncbi:pyrroloquinoline quinone biosynthesis protein PqqE [Hydrogenophaga sp.]|uniref:pyrroloquinoline quinone biosynthesis protein PqqE n=1 Tax=Hydrogenophaga sp. TaxID=1904254 RepID=UPI0025BCBEB4|nr:pyrroloquinoline quinone biosynthesis protein PqqE [Hydrogenophaga sp.]MBT9465323.1 pyrroloquinoline quinone biosynthesis protein PqqE [Hydrogenophaga sp.]
MLAAKTHPAGPPLWLLAELTYQCPLHCGFCYNPTQHARIKDELTTAQWVDVMRQARKLGAAQLGFSGGEPLVRDDLEELVQEAHALGYYTNLITSGVGLTEARAQRLKDAGLDHVQLSFQDSTRELNDFLSHTRTFELKQKVARLIKAHDWPMVMNCVLHRHNLPHVGEIIEMALALDAEYLELANTQYYGWAWVNRDHLMPTHEALIEAEAVVERYRETIDRRCKILFVVPDYFEQRPKACMNGWGSVFLSVAPDGVAMPCHNARDLPGLKLPNVRDMALADIWQKSQAFNAFRGEDWMKPPCRTCDERHKDFGGCHCQAFLITGDATQADPVCGKSPHHDKVVQLVKQAPAQRHIPIVFRSDVESRLLHPQA